MSGEAQRGVRSGTITLAEFGGFLARRKRLILGLFTVILSVASVLLWLWPDSYEAEMRVVVRRARTGASVGTGGENTEAGVADSAIASEIELFRNPRSLEQAVVRCGLDKEIRKYRDNHRARTALAVRELNRWLVVERINKTNLISIRYRNRDPKRAAEVLKTLSEIYMAKHTAVRRNRGVSGFFSEQTALYKKRLDEAQASLTEFRRRHRVSLLAAEKDAALRRGNELERNMEDTESRIRAAEDRAASLRRQIGKLPATIETQIQTARNQALLEHLKSTLLELENQRTDLLTKYDSGYRLVREVEQKIADTRRMIEREQQTRVVGRTHAVNPLRQSLEGDLLRTQTMLAGLKAQRRALAHDLAKIRSERSQLERITAEHDDLVRQVKLAEANFFLYRKKGEESRLADAMDKVRILNVSVLDEPFPPAIPIDHHKGFLFLLALALAALGSVGIAWTADNAGRVFQTIRQSASENGEEDTSLRETDTEVVWKMGAAGASCDNPVRALVATPLLPDRDAPSPHGGTPFSDFWAAAGFNPDTPAAGPLPIVREMGGVVEMMSRDLIRRDEFGSVIDYLSSFRKLGAGLAIGLAPEIEAEEAALAVAQLAYSMNRRNGLPVLLVDGDNDNGTLARLFGVADGPGFADLLCGPPGMENRCIHRTRFENLWVLPGGGPPVNGNVSAERLQTTYRALASRSLNLIIHLPRYGRSKPMRMLYSVPDAVISDLTGEGPGRRTAQYLTRCVMEAKKEFSECRVTLVGGIKDWGEADKHALTVC